MPKVTNRIAGRQLQTPSASNITNAARSVPIPNQQPDLFKQSALDTAAPFVGVADSLVRQAQERQLQRERNDALQRLSQFEMDTFQRQQELNLEEVPEDKTLFDVHKEAFDQAEAEFLGTVPTFMQNDIRLKTAQVRQSHAARSIGEQSRRDGIQAKTQTEQALINYENLTALQPQNADRYKADLAEVVNGLRVDPATRKALLQQGNQRIDAAQAEFFVRNTPEQFIEDASKGKFPDLENRDKFVDAAKNQIETNKKLKEKAIIAAREATFEQKIENEEIIMDLFDQDDTSYDVILNKINEMDLKGEVRDDFAKEARAYVKSTKEINASTNNDVMAGITTRMYDLNEIADTDPKAFLEGLHNIRTEILKRRADGELGRDDEVKLNKQIKSLMSANIAEATNMVSISFGEARKMIEQSLPPDLRGVAIRKLFYATEEDRIKAEKDNDQRKNLKAAYKNQARQIIDELNNERRSTTLKAIEATQTTTTQDDAAFLKSINATMDDVRETAEKHGMTEQQVIQRLRAGNG